MRWVGLTFSVCLIVFGLWFSSTNAATFVKGYFLFKAGQVQADNPSPAEAVPTPQQQKEKAIEGPLYPVRPEVGETIGELYIPALAATLPIVHGTDEDELAKGVGHFAGSVLPGEQDNSVLSGHRDTVFRKLGEVKKGDELVVTTAAGTFTYKVKKIRIVDEDDRTVIVPKPKATLTVTTCYPFDFVGSAPERYILIADLVDQQLN